MVCSDNSDCPEADEACEASESSLVPASVGICTQQRWGQCPGGNDNECLPDESCRNDGNNNICVLDGCTTANDCPAAPAGSDATPSCNLASNQCLLTCVLAATTCPTDMSCVFGQNHCQWSN